MGMPAMTNLSMPRCDIEELKGQIEQLKALNTADDYLIKLLEEQNQQLKELLKECRNCVTRQIYGSPTRQYFEGVFDDELLTKIDNALGEKK